MIIFSDALVKRRPFRPKTVDKSCTYTEYLLCTEKLGLCQLISIITFRIYVLQSIVGKCTAAIFFVAMDSIHQYIIG
jgi:hypothetical protein